MSNNGVLVLSEDKKILFNNEKVLELLDERKGNLDHIFSKYMPQINNIISNKNVIDSHEIINIKGQNYMISVNSVETEYVVVLSKTETIEKMERNVRQKLYGKEFNAKYTFNDIMTRSPQVNNLKEFAFKAAQTQYSIVIYGESGTGKELFAQAIHNASPRAGGPFVPANIAALQDNLIESELFGYEVGAFTGANKSGKPGIFEMAHNGTVFLDEIGELSLRLQSKLLRVLQEREVMRVGGTKIIPINVRIIAATNKNLHDMVSKGKFRSDLYYRLNVLPMTLIPLRDRISDIELLIEHFLSQVGMPIHCIPPDIMTRLKKHSWPGNIRELENLCNYISLMWDIYCNEKEIIKENIFGYIGKMESSDQTAAENVTFITQKLEQSGYLQEFISILTILKTAYKQQEIMSRSKLYNRLSPISRLSVQQIRERLKLLAEHGLVLSGSTKQGTRITEKGIKYLSESEIGVN
jgi:transcriptional regulator with PAS, ATPase and Fis domain